MHAKAPLDNPKRSNCMSQSEDQKVIGRDSRDGGDIGGRVRFKKKTGAAQPSLRLPAATTVLHEARN
jgi:hypothetical protein